MAIYGFHLNTAGGFGTPVTPPFGAAPLGNSTYIYALDPIVWTTNASYTSGGIAVVRTLLQADATAGYMQGGAGPICGILGFAFYQSAANSGGITTAPQQITSGQVQYPYGQTGLIGRDPKTGRDQQQLFLAGFGNEFTCNLNTTATGGASQVGINISVGTKCGFIFSGGANSATNNTAFYLDTNSPAPIMEITGCDLTDPLNNPGNPQAGGRMFFRVLEPYCQYTNGNPYTAQ
jgi:hypothetical protein